MDQDFEEASSGREVKNTIVSLMHLVKECDTVFHAKDSRCVDFFFHSEKRFGIPAAVEFTTVPYVRDNGTKYVGETKTFFRPTVRYY